MLSVTFQPRLETKRSFSDTIRWKTRIATHCKSNGSGTVPETLQRDNLLLLQRYARTITPDKLNFWLQ